MAFSLFGKAPIKIVASSEPLKDEQYVLRGMDMIHPDQVIDTDRNLSGKLALAQNSRMFSRLDGEKRVAQRTRKGSISLMSLEDYSDVPLTISHNM